MTQQLGERELTFDRLETVHGGEDDYGGVQTFDDGSTLQTFDDGSTLATDTEGGTTASPATDTGSYDTTSYDTSSNDTGSYDIVCAELCGWGHYKMKGRATFEPRTQFEAWIAEKTTEQEARTIVLPEGEE